MIEIWQPGPDGGFGPTEGFSHWGRQSTDADTVKAVFATLKPGHPEDHAPHVLVWIVARGLNMALTTRLHFPDEQNGRDAVFALAGDRYHSLLAQEIDGGYRHVIYLQGKHETAFFDV